MATAPFNELSIHSPIPRFFKNSAKPIDMFPSTLSAKNAVDMFPRMDGSKDIRSVLSSHVECVVLLQNQTGGDFKG